jgi:hypothetical protein
MDVRLGREMNDGMQDRSKAAAAYTAQVACASIVGKEPWTALLTTHDGVASSASRGTALERGR